MGKFFGKVGYAEQMIEYRPGCYRPETVEKEYYGDLVKNYAKINSINVVNENVDLMFDISIVADSFANENFYDIRWVEYQGCKWKVVNVTPQFPRLVLTTGGKYDGGE